MCKCFHLPHQVVVGPNIALPPGTKLTLKQKVEDDADFGMDELSLEDKEKVTEPVGKKAKSGLGRGRASFWGKLQIIFRAKIPNYQRAEIPPLFSANAEFNPEEVGAEGEGYIWNPDVDSDQETDEQDPWGKKSRRVFRRARPLGYESSACCFQTSKTLGVRKLGVLFSDE